MEQVDGRKAGSMSVLIKGLNKPQSCGDCWADDWFCNRWRKRNWGMPPPDDCPIEAAPAADATDENVGEWIPVTERCPEKSGDYLVFDDCRNLYVNEWHYLLKKWQYDDSRITHWMPLPEPPEEET